jgi:hypothetical protein
MYLDFGAALDALLERARHVFVDALLGGVCLCPSGPLGVGNVCGW